MTCAGGEVVAALCGLRVCDPPLSHERERERETGYTDDPRWRRVCNAHCGVLSVILEFEVGSRLVSVASCRVQVWRRR